MVGDTTIHAAATGQGVPVLNATEAARAIVALRGNAGVYPEYGTDAYSNDITSPNPKEPPFNEYSLAYIKADRASEPKWDLQLYMSSRLGSLPDGSTVLEVTEAVAAPNLRVNGALYDAAAWLVLKRVIGNHDSGIAVHVHTSKPSKPGRDVFTRAGFTWKPGLYQPNLLTATVGHVAHVLHEMEEQRLDNQA